MNISLFRRAGYIQERHYGFVKGRSVSDAVARLRMGVVEIGGLYISVVAVDIEGTFDNLWWYLVYRRLSNARVAAYLGMMMSYFLEGRKVHLESAELNRDLREGVRRPKSLTLSSGL